MDPQHAAPGAHFGRDPERAELLALEVSREPAADTHVVVVGSRVGVEPRPLAGRPKGRNRTDVVQEPQRTVDSVQRHGGDPPSHRPPDLLRIRMIFGAGDLPEYLKTLMGQLHPCGDARVFESTDTIMDLRILNSQELLRGRNETGNRIITICGIVKSIPRMGVIPPGRPLDPAEGFGG